MHRRSLISTESTHTLDPYLESAIAIVAQKDAGAFRRQIFAELARRKWVIRTVIAVHRLLGRSWLSTLLVSLYGLKSFVAVSMPSTHGTILTTHKYRNEERQLDYLNSLAPADMFGRIGLGLAALFNPLNWGAVLGGVVRCTGGFRYLRLVHQYNQTGDFLVACRVASTAGYFIRFQRLLNGTSARATLVTSDSNPYAMGLSYAGRSLGLKSLYITHGHIPDGPPALDFDLSILDGAAVLDVYRESGPAQGRVVYKGAEGQYRPMDVSGLQKDEPLTLGVFTSLVVDWDKFSTVFESLQTLLQPGKVILRLHPNQIMRDPAALKIAERWDNVELSLGEHVLNADAARCDLVVVGGSSCHLSVLKHGVPTLSVPELDDVPVDFYRFIGRGIVLHVDDSTQLTLEEVAAFYSNPDWVARFHVFDAAYPAQQESCDNAVRLAIQEFVS